MSNLLSPHLYMHSSDSVLLHGLSRTQKVPCVQPAGATRMGWQLKTLSPTPQSPAQSSRNAEGLRFPLLQKLWPLQGQTASADISEAHAPLSEHETQIT